MIIAIDASNIRAGGGLTHLKEIVNRVELEQHGIDKIILLSNRHTLDKISNRAGIVKLSDTWLNRGMLFSFLFQIFKMNGVLQSNRVDLLFVPGGTYFGAFRPYVTMSQNMLPFQQEEYRRFKQLKTRLRFQILRLTQAYTFKKAKGIIFISDFARKYITKTINLEVKSQLISHGINEHFTREPKPQKPIEVFSTLEPFKLLYVSIVSAYKHQWNVADAVIRLRKEGFPVSLDLVGEMNDEWKEKLDRVMEKDTEGCVRFNGFTPYEELASIYKNADGFVFASSCENQPIILIEAMSAGLPIACSDMGPMLEVLGEKGFYFNPLSVDSIYTCLKDFILNPQERELSAMSTYQKATQYSWKDCSDKTFGFLKNIYMDN
ncbi:MAG: glycosyltransferase family 4 protein [Bacteroidetes bacterium]|nr:glycosyltransferase family 4 protein [Bacteroidota bacterium]